MPRKNPHRSDDAIRATHDLAERCEFAFEFGRLRFPHYAPEDSSTPHEFLARLAHEGLQRRYGALAHTHEAQLREELSIIAEVGYEEYFLVVWDILHDCQRRGIAWITRGSAADSLVCYALGISGVCPIRFELYFRRFLNRERMALNKLPDIDIDFAHDRKDDVVDLIFERFGSRHAAIVGGLSTYQGRSAIADIAKVLGVSEFQIRRLTEHVPRASAGHVAAAVAGTQECRDSPWHEEPYRTALQMALFLDGFPRHPKMHPCGVVLSRDPITALTPTFTSAKGYATTHFEMEAVETVGLVKMDILAQGGLAVIRDTLALLAERRITPDLENLEPWEDAEIWKMIATGNARGVHHIESPAMISLARMCGVRDIDCLIAIVSVIRPGAANSSKKSEFARRAQGLEPVQYAHPSLEPALHMTFGVVAYEEHILQICEAFAGLNPGRADVLRRALVKEKDAVIEVIRLEFVAAAKALQRTDDEIARVWELVGGFRGYAFCRAHSTAYGVEAYQGAYLKHYHPAEFLASVLSNGKGFYSTLAYTLECRRLGLTFLSPDVNASRWNFAPEEGRPRAIRVSLRFIKSITAALLERYKVERARAPFASLRDFYERTRPTGAEMLNLIRAGAFDGFGEPRTAQFWHLQHVAQWPHAQGYLFQSDEGVRLPEVPLTEPDHAQRLRDETELLSFTVSGHPLEQFPDVAWDTYCPIRYLDRYPGEIVHVCGLIIADRSHHQVTGDQMKFITICDYTGIIECEIFAQTYRRFGLETVRNPVVEVEARVTPFESGLGCTLNVLRIGRARLATTSTNLTVQRVAGGKELPWKISPASLPANLMDRDPLLFLPANDELPPAAVAFGFRSGQIGTHTSRTIMLEDATALFSTCPRNSARAEYREEIMAHNCLGKRTISTRKASDQRLSELYALDPGVPLFRIMRGFWDNDERGRPLLAALLALARDPLLRFSAEPILRSSAGEQVSRQRFTEAIARATGGRFNDSILDKIVRNVGASWTQSGHLLGRSHKIRCAVQPTPHVTAFALLQGFILGGRGRALFQTLPARVLDAPFSTLVELAQDAKRLGLLDLKVSGDVIEITFPALLTDEERRLAYGKN